MTPGQAIAGAVTLGGAYAVIVAILLAVYAAGLVVMGAIDRAAIAHLTRDAEQAERIALQRDKAGWS